MESSKKKKRFAPESLLLPVAADCTSSVHLRQPLLPPASHFPFHEPALFHGCHLSCRVHSVGATAGFTDTANTFSENQFQNC